MNIAFYIAVFLILGLSVTVGLLMRYHIIPTYNFCKEGTTDTLTCKWDIYEQVGVSVLMAVILLPIAYFILF